MGENFNIAFQNIETAPNNERDVCVRNKSHKKFIFRRQNNTV